MLTHRTTFAAMLFILSACATADQTEKISPLDDPRLGEKVDRLCFTSSIDSFGETTRNTVVVREGFDHYLIETYGGCLDLDWAQSIALDSFSGCLTRGDEVFAFDSPFGPDRTDRPISCTVKAIYKWNLDAEAESEEDEDADQSEPTEDTETSE